MREKILKILKDNRKEYLILKSWLYLDQEGIITVALRYRYDTEKNIHILYDLLHANGIHGYLSEGNIIYVSTKGA